MTHIRLEDRKKLRILVLKRLSEDMTALTIREVRLECHFEDLRCLIFKGTVTRSNLIRSFLLIHFRLEFVLLTRRILRVAFTSVLRQFIFNDFFKPYNKLFRFAILAERLEAISIARVTLPTKLVQNSDLTV